MYYLPDTQATKWNYNKCIFARSDRFQINFKTNEKQLSVYDDVFHWCAVFFQFWTFMLIPIQTYQKQSYKVGGEG